MILKKVIKKDLFFYNRQLVQKVDLIINNLSKNYFLLISDFLQIPEKEINFYFAKKLFNALQPNNKIFSKINFWAIVPFIFIFFFYIFFVFVKKNKKKINKNNYFTIFDDIHSISDMKYFFKFEKISNLKTAYNISKNFIVKKKNIIFFKRFNQYDIKTLELFFYIKNFFYLLIYSIKYRINFFYLFIIFFDDFLYYRSFFYRYNCKYLLSFRHYNTNNLKKYFANKFNCKYAIIQKNLNLLNQSSFYYSANICFTLSRQFSLSTIKKSIIDLKVPMGSLLMETNFHNFIINNLKKYNNFDILYLASNERYPGGAYDVTLSSSKDYALVLYWLKKVSKAFPKLQIGFKPHPNNIQDYEKLFFKDTNIIYLDKSLNSYHCANKSKIILSWSSTLILEMRSINKQAFFLNPFNRNKLDLNELKDSDPININNYKNLINIINVIIFKKKNIYSRYIKNINNSYYCVNSKNYSRNLFDFLKYNNKNT